MKIYIMVQHFYNYNYDYDKYEHSGYTVLSAYQKLEAAEDAISETTVPQVLGLDDEIEKHLDNHTLSSFPDHLEYQLLSVEVL